MKSHAAQNVLCFGEFKIAVLNHLDPVTPGIEEVEEIPVQHLCARFDQEIPHRATIIDDNTEMTILAGR